MWIETGYGKIVLVCVASLVISASGLLVKASQVDGVILYSKFSVTLLSEFLKLCISSTFLVTSFIDNRPSKNDDDTFPTVRDVGLYSIPALLYVITNNIKYPILERINPGVFSIVWNLKIAGIAFLLSFFLRREITRRKWLGVFLLVVGSSLAEASQWHSRPQSSPQEEEITAAARVQGIELVAIALIAVSVANVTCEYIYKKTTDSVIPVSFHKQNFVLYSWGVTLNSLAWFFIHIDSLQSFFQNYTRWTVAVVIMNGVSGYLVGAMFKYIDSIAAIFADLIAMFTTAIVSAIVFELDINLLFCLGFGVSSLSIWTYYGEEEEKTKVQIKNGNDEGAEMVTLISNWSQEEEEFSE